jgi:hypothetical protein
VKTCNACDIAKANQNNVTKVSDYVKSKVVDEIFFPDLSSIKPPKKGV